ncbi:hypothetical protein OG455_41595 [Kitasatospora sp. NBC_01287]|nr:hypothetical protein [Kitasatospora sp. NBC_01287]MCX4750979.1 hypothetical protein [Kitasatospora sp. NBC_01287]MCX4751770.1 hypothetical protein [Kitasatospora sp. NBC_01287]MCX4751938.1 hypothetical protein [Kitasatospora sp. NBC_01287]
MIDQKPDAYDEDEDDPFDHDGCYQPHVRSGDYYDCDGRPL